MRFKEGFNFTTNLLWNHSVDVVLIYKIQGKVETWFLFATSFIKSKTWCENRKQNFKRMSYEQCYIDKGAQVLHQIFTLFALYIDSVTFLFHFMRCYWFSIFASVLLKSIQFHSLQCDLFMSIDTMLGLLMLL